MYDKYSDGNRDEINKLAQYRFQNFTEMLSVIKGEIEKSIDEGR